MKNKNSPSEHTGPAEQEPQGYRARIARQYGSPHLADKLLASLQNEGKNVERLARDDLKTFEEFHLRGRRATRELAHLAGIGAHMQVLDLGCGVGGPARSLAAEFGCQVVGLDLSFEYCRATAVLSARLGMGKQIKVVHGNALQLPFQGAAFHLVWSQHTLMNVPAKVSLFEEVQRVLRPGGRLAFYEVLVGSGAALDFPLPWADSWKLSFLPDAEGMLHDLAACGFSIESWQDVTDEVLEWGKRAMATDPGRAAPLGLDLVIGADHARKTANLLAALGDGRVVVVQGVAAHR
jgi:SAM-dependent methyltransferase